MTNNKKIIAFIPARGGSKRLEGKNIRLFAGVPLIEYTIRFAIRSGVFSRIIVSTDDNAIAAISRSAGAEVIIRPDHLAQDTTSTSAVAEQFIREVDPAGESDFLCTLQPTNPLRPAELINQAIELITDDINDKVIMSVSECDYKLGKLLGANFQPLNYSFGERSQDMNKYYFENGLLYLTPSRMIREGKFFGEGAIAVKTDKFYAFDIDDLADFQLAETFFQIHKDHFKHLL